MSSSNLLVIHTESERPTFVWLVQGQQLGELAPALRKAPETYGGCTTVFALQPAVSHKSSFDGIMLRELPLQEAVSPAASAFKKFMHYTRLSGHIDEEDELKWAAQQCLTRLKELQAQAQTAPTASVLSTSPQPDNATNNQRGE